jgi:hypothetical protein
MPVQQMIKRREQPVLLEEQKKKETIPSIQVDKIPSNFKPYNMSKGGIFYKPYTYGELLYFNQSKMDVPTMIEFVLKGVSAPFPVMDLAYFDYLFLSVLRRMVTFETNVFSIVAICEECGLPISIKKDLAELDFDDLKADLPVILPTPEGDLQFYPLTVGKYCELYRQGLLDNDLQLLSSQVINKPFPVANKILSELTGDVLFELPKIDDHLTFGIKSLEVKCENEVEKINDNGEREKGICDHINFVDPFDRESVIVPFRTPRHVDGGSIRFGV